MSFSTSVSMSPTQAVNEMGVPVDANGNATSATLSNITLSSSDPTVFTVAADPNAPGGGILTGVAAGTATLTETANSSDGTATISGSLSVTISASQVGVSTAIAFIVGTPVTTGQPLP